MAAPSKSLQTLASLAFRALIVFYFGFAGYTIFRGTQDSHFNQCWNRSWVMLIVSISWSMILAILPWLTFQIVPEKHASTMWLVTVLLDSSFVAFQYVGIDKLTKTFQGYSGPLSTELEFSFGQLIVFFMILQLIIEFAVAFRGKAASQYRTSACLNRI